ncbi:MAG TPA: MFS transporter [Dehalococcoidales bacterium]|nr:MFS transporter [Dehalococcoidales bacterium]
MKDIYYGWYIIAACFFSSLYVAGIVVFGFTAFFEPFITTFGWSYAQVSVAVSLRGAETGLIAPLLGYWVDRRGPRWLLFSGSILVGISLIILSKMQSLVGFYTGAIILAFGTSLCSPAVVAPSAANWFKKRLGMATGILAAGFGFGGLLIPVIIQLINTAGWRETLFILGIGALVICLPLSLVVRHRPEQYGLRPDGEKAPEEKAAGANNAQSIPALSTGRDYTTREALTSRAFWHLTLGFTLQYMVVGSVLAHIMPFLSSVQIDRSTAGFLAAAVPVVSIAGRLASGWASDRLDRKSLAVLSFAVITAATLLFDFSGAGTLWLMVVAVGLFGISYGSANTLRAVLLREYFGRSRFGTVFGFLMGFLSLGVIVGPLLAGWIFDTFQSYSYAWWLFTLLNAAALLLIITLPKAKSL